MPSVNENSDKTKNQESKKKHSFFGGKIDLKAKDLLDFRYNSQEEIDKLNEEIEINEELKDSIEDENHEEKEEIKEDVKEEENKAEDEEGAENTLEENLNEIDEPTDNSVATSEYDGEEGEPISGVVIPKEKDEKDDEESNEDKDEGDNEIVEGNVVEDEEDSDTENDNSIESLDDSEEKDDENEESVKFFDPFELNLDEDENEEDEDEEDDMVNPFGLEEDNEEEKENNTEEIVEEEEKKEDEEATDDENEEATDDEEEEVIDDEEEETTDDEEEETTDEEEEEVTDEEEEEVTDNNANKEDDKDEEEFIVNTNAQLDESIKSNKHKHKKQEEEEIELQETDTSEDNYELTEDELFEQEPEFFGDDELSQKFLELVKVARNIFKIERKNGTQDPYYKIVGGKSTNSTLEYLFYLIEEEGEPIDLFIKKVETDSNSGDENEHLVQFSYDQEQNLNIFVDEIILYEKVNKSEKNSSEWNDTKIILEKFTFLSETYYKELKDKREKEQEEKKKKKQLQNIFKEF